MLLGQARVAVVGIGGVGSTAALALTMSGIGHLHCVDPDVVELSNLNRQILYTERDLGRPKVHVAVERLREHNSDVYVTGEQLSIDGLASLRTLAIRFDVLLLATNQPQEIRSWANQACQETGTAWVHGGHHGPHVNIGLYQPGTGPCYDCGYTAKREFLAELPSQTPSTTAATHEPRAANAVSVGITGQLAAHAVASLITGSPALKTNSEYRFNLVTFEDSVAPGLASPRPDCPTCASNAQLPRGSRH
jgi:molybdopterin/thiamine biosynthesis adenylyltransferase